MEASSGYKDYVAGLMAGIATITSGHPFDTVEVKLQKYYTEAGGVKYKNGLHRATRILQIEEGEVDVGKPQPHAIVPSVAFGGAIMSFILCPSELVKASDARVPNFLLYLECRLCYVVFRSSVGCKFRALIL